MKPTKDRLTVIKQTELHHMPSERAYPHTPTEGGSPHTPAEVGYTIHQQREMPPKAIRGGYPRTPAEVRYPHKSSEGGITIHHQRGIPHTPSERGYKKRRKHLLHLKNRLHFAYVISPTFAIVIAFQHHFRLCRQGERV